MGQQVLYYRDLSKILKCTLKVVLFLHHVGPPLPEWGSPGKPQTTQQTSDEWNHIFRNLVRPLQSTSAYYKSSGCKNGLEPPASGCPLRRPLQERSLCKVGRRRRRQQVQGWVELHPPIGSLLLLVLPASIAAGVAAVHTRTARQQ